MKYALENDGLRRASSEKYGRIGVRVPQKEAAPKVFVALLVGRGQTGADGARLAIAKAWAGGLEGVEVLADLLYRDESVDEVAYEDRAQVRASISASTEGQSR